MAAMDCWLVLVGSWLNRLASSSIFLLLGRSLSPMTSRLLATQYMPTVGGLVPIRSLNFLRLEYVSSPDGFLLVKKSYPMMLEPTIAFACRTPRNEKQKPLPTFKMVIPSSVLAFFFGFPVSSCAFDPSHG